MKLFSNEEVNTGRQWSFDVAQAVLTYQNMTFRI